MKTVLTYRAVALAIIGALVLGLALVGCSKEKAADTSQATKEVAKADTAQAAKTPRFVQPLPPGNIRASHILISYKGTPVTEATRSQAEAKKLAEDLLAKVRQGESFEDLARTYSDCPSAEAGGDLGFFPKGRMVAPFDQAAFALQPGKISKVVETQFGYHIIKRTQ
jgi:parvulin-like peptidyl-prolyl isomerase